MNLKQLITLRENIEIDGGIYEDQYEDVVNCLLKYEEAIDILQFYASASYHGYQASAQEDGGKKAKEFLMKLPESVSTIKREPGDGK